MRAACKNIFREYNIPRDKPKKKRKRSSNPRHLHKSLRINTTTTSSSSAEECIENFSDDENLSTPRYPYVQLRRSFEIPLKLVQKSLFKSPDNVVSNSRQQHTRKVCKWIKKGEIMPTPPEEDSDDDLMPRPIMIKEEPLTQQPSEEFRLSMPCSTESASINSLTPRLRSKLSSDESSISSGEEDAGEDISGRRKKSKILGGTVKRSRKDILARYRPLDISITKINSPTKKKATPRNRKSKAIGKRKTRSQKTQAANNDLDTSWAPLSEDEPFNSLSAERSFVCSSPNPSQVINTPSGTPSPRKRPSELDLMIELIEKENSMRNASIRKSPRKLSRRCLPGGLLEIYQRSMGKAKADARFLKHDKNFGLRNGLILRVLNIESSHGVHVARVQTEDGDNTFLIVLPPQKVSQIKLDSKIEAFFDESTQPYGLKTKDGNSLKVFIKPYKLLLL